MTASIITEADRALARKCAHLLGGNGLTQEQSIECIAALLVPLREDREKLVLARAALSDIHLTAHCIAKAGPLHTPTLQDAWGRFMEISAKATNAAYLTRPEASEIGSQNSA